MNAPRFSSDPEPRRRSVIGVAWYRREEWELLRAMAADADSLEKTYEEWLAVAEKTLRKLRQQGLELHKVDVDVTELAAWCRAQGRPLDGGARAEFARSRGEEASR